MSIATLSCGRCGAELTIEELFQDALDQRAFAHLAKISIPLGARVLQYLTLFAPPKNRLTLTRKTRLITELLPDMQRQAIDHKGREWEAPLEAWALALDTLQQHREQGRLTLPLKSHGYLYAVIAGMADKVERAGEQQTEHERRHRSGPGGVLDELEPELQATQQAIARRAERRELMTLEDIRRANPHLVKGPRHE